MSNPKSVAPQRAAQSNSAAQLSQHAPPTEAPGREAPRRESVHTRSARSQALLALAIDRSQSLETRYRIALRAEDLLDQSQPSDVVAAVAGVKAEAVRLARGAIANSRSVDLARDQAESLGVWIITAADRAYPKRLLELELPPPCLFCRSATDPNASRDLLNNPAIGIVGPRNADPYGLEAARWFATDLSEAGLVITSGFARGVDGASHEAAARSGNPTVAILGCGVDRTYPRQNQHLIEPILSAGGMIVSEFPLGTPPAAWRFPVRNRLIAAQTLGMIVVQASLRSGSLISARLALECGREVFAIPGRIFDQRSKGANLLLRDGAHVALEPQSVLDTLPLRVRDKLLRQRLGTDGALRQAALLKKLALEQLTAEQLSQALGLNIEVVLVDLTEMELSGLIDRFAGGHFRAPDRNTTR